MAEGDIGQAVLPSTCQLYLGDCLDVMPKLAANSVMMTFADLPFGLPSTAMTWDIPIDIKAFFEGILRLGNDANLLFTATQPFTSKIITAMPRKFRYAMVWQKNIATNFFNAKTQPLRAHEDILVFGEAGATYNPQMRQGFKPYKGIKKIERSRQFNSANRKPRAYENKTGDRYPISVLCYDVPSSKERLHPTQKPKALLEWLIATYTNPGDTVLDPAFGSCVTGVACARLGRNFIGIEKNFEYFKAGKERVEQERKRLELIPTF